MILFTHRVHTASYIAGKLKERGYIGPSIQLVLKLSILKGCEPKSLSVEFELKYFLLRTNDSAKSPP